MLKMDKNSAILSILIMVQPILDMLSYFAIQLGLTTVTSVLRLAFFGGIMAYSFILSNRKKVYYIFAGVVGAYWIIHMLLCARDGYAWVSDLNGFLRTIQMPALAIGFITLFKHAKNFPNEIGKYFAINYIIIAASIVLSYLVGMPVHTYSEGVGIKGWFYTGNSQSYILSVMAMPALYYFYQKKNNVGFIFTMILAFALMFLLGTQVTLYSIFITIISFMVILIWNREKRWVMASALAVSLVVVISVCPYAPANQISAAEAESLAGWEQFLQNQDKEPDKVPVEVPDKVPSQEPDKEPDNNPDKAPDSTGNPLTDTILEGMVERFGYEKVVEIYGGEIDGAELMDYRQKKANFGLLLMEEKDIGTWLFGIEDTDMRFKEETYDPENDFPAIFFFYGIVGLLLYVAFLGYFAILLIKDIFKNLKKLPVERVILGLSLVLTMGCAELSANVLRRPNASIYTSLLLAYAYYVCKEGKEQDNESQCNCPSL